ncbi:hypothetical protein QOT17_023819 [Balamuthia mandrillaris]
MFRGIVKKSWATRQTFNNENNMANTVGELVVGLLTMYSANWLPWKKKKRDSSPFDMMEEEPHWGYYSSDERAFVSPSLAELLSELRQGVRREPYTSNP